MLLLYCIYCMCGRLGVQLMDRFDKNSEGTFEDISEDDASRATSLIRRYHHIYSDERVDLLDVLEHTLQGQTDLVQGQTDLVQGRSEDDPEDARSQPEQLLLSIIVVSCIHTK